MRLRSGLGRVGAAAVAAAAALAAGCGEEERADAGPAMSSPRVAMTVTYPGYQPFALISYRDRRGRRCHGLGTLTRKGPRLLGALDASLADALSRGGACMGPDSGDVSVQVRQVGRGSVRLVGGVVREGVTRVVVAGQRIRPRAGGEFLVAQPAAAGSLGSEIQLEYRAGGHRRVPLRTPPSSS